MKRAVVGAAALGASALVGGLLFVPTAVSSTPGAFHYTGDSGPAFWAEIDPAWDACAGAGGEQTPINIGSVVADPSLDPLDLDLHATPVELLNNGHAIEQEYEAGSSIVVGGVTYDLLQFHFHTLSEHTVRRAQSPMEMHAVFKDTISGDLVVVGTFFNLGPESHFLGELITAGLPEKEGDHTTGGEIDVADVLTPAATSSYYTYSGSLTTPPCSEIVTWYVLKRPQTMSRDQFVAFREIMGNNFRPIQPRMGRIVLGTP